MALATKVDLIDHFAGVGGLRTTLRRLDITDPRTYNETKGGEGLTNEYGTPLWYGEVTVVPLHNALMRPLEARVRWLQRGDVRFYVGDLMDDPITVTPPASFTLNSVGASGNVRFNKIDATPGIPIGTYFSFDFAGRRAFHQLQELLTPGVAEATNMSSYLSIYPPIQPGWTADTSVTFGADAKCLAYMVPGSLETAEAGSTTTGGFRFAWKQTLAVS